MKAKYDIETIKLTPRFIKAIKELMAAECETMQKNKIMDAEYWTCGRCLVNNLSSSNCLEFTYGGDEDFEGKKRFKVFSAQRNKI